MNREQIVEFLAREFPHHSRKLVIDEVRERAATVRHKIGPEELRPGGTVAGPVSMLLADVVMYVAILGTLGYVPLAVTTSLTINFMRKPSAERDLVAHCRLMKVGRNLVVGEVDLRSEGDPELVAHVVSTYAIPPTDRG